MSLMDTFGALEFADTGEQTVNHNEDSIQMVPEPGEQIRLGQLARRSDEPIHCPVTKST